MQSFFGKSASFADSTDVAVGRFDRRKFLSYISLTPGVRYELVRRDRLVKSVRLFVPPSQTSHPLGIGTRW
jgi:hypothetical protein